MDFKATRQYNPNLKINGELWAFLPGSISYNAGEDGTIPFISVTVPLREGCEILFNDCRINKKTVQVCFQKPVKHCLVFEDMRLTPGQRDFTEHRQRLISIIWEGCKQAVLRIE